MRGRRRSRRSLRCGSAPYHRVRPPRQEEHADHDPNSFRCRNARQACCGNARATHVPDMWVRTEYASGSRSSTRGPRSRMAPSECRRARICRPPFALSPLRTPRTPLSTSHARYAGDSLVLTGTFADAACRGDLPVPVAQWLAENGWTAAPSLRCPDHRRAL